MRSVARKYLELAKAHGQDPNFWMSEEFIEKAGLYWVIRGPLVGFQQDGEWFFPPYDVCMEEFITGISYTSFLGFQLGAFLDYQFIYDPKKFLDLSGGAWKVFRKNINKHSGHPWVYRPIIENDLEQVELLLLQWADERELFDPEVFVRFVCEGEHRWGLFLNDTLHAVNVADTNYRYINFRYCIDNGSKYLNEYARFVFYCSEWVQVQNKLVNDGGCLDTPSLGKFKEKLNPCAVVPVFTFK